MDDYIYCSPFLPVLSTDAIAAERGEALPDYVDPGDNPEIALIKKLDAEALNAWVRQLPPKLAEVARGLLNDETQAAIARRLKVSEPAITKRLKRLVPLARTQIGHLKRSPVAGWRVARI